ncbi:MAG: hypothetical protein GSR80_001013 [Desulfurococcales archaeon]|nr:hypothetical protein [Desulfurococcales archaeon]
MPRGRGGESPLERCFGRWRVEIPDSLREELEGRYSEALRRLEERRATWEADLNSDRRAIYRILREEMVVEELRIRRTRVGDYRFLFEVIASECLVRFLSIDLTPKRSKVYDRLRKRKL